MNFLRKINKYKYLIIIIILASILIFQPRMGLISLIRLYNQKQQYEKNIMEMKAKIIIMQNKVERLRKDNDYIEAVIREELGMIKRGEKILKE